MRLCRGSLRIEQVLLLQWIPGYNLSASPWRCTNMRHIWRAKPTLNLASQMLPAYYSSRALSIPLNHRTTNVALVLHISLVRQRDRHETIRPREGTAQYVLGLRHSSRPDTTIRLPARSFEITNHDISEQTCLVWRDLDRCIGRQEFRFALRLPSMPLVPNFPLLYASV